MSYTVNKIGTNSAFNVLEKVFDLDTEGYICADHHNKTIYMSLNKKKGVFCSNKVKFDNINIANYFMEFWREAISNAGDAYMRRDSSGVWAATVGIDFQAQCAEYWYDEDDKRLMEKGLKCF